MKALIAVLMTLVALSAECATGRRPNLLYIFTDDQSVRSVGCYPQSYPWVKTPNIDRLASQGVRFDSLYMGAMCVPSRAIALTGQLQTRYTKETPYWVENLRKSGYYTGMIGKWHWNVPRHGLAWDWSVVWEHYLGDEVAGGYYNGQNVSINGGQRVPLGGYSTDRYTDYTVEFLKERARHKDQPWFIWVCYGAVHGPYTPAPRHLEEYLQSPAVPIPTDVFGPRPDKPDNMVNVTRWAKDKNGLPVWKKRSLDSWVKQYFQGVRAIDEGVGRILQALKDTGQLDNTILVFSADQGFAWGQHGLRDKIAPYDASLLSPLIFYAPGRFAQGAVCAQPVSGVDVIRTFHTLTELQPAQPLDGRDFSALLKDPAQSGWTSEPMLQIYTGHLYGNEAITQALRRAINTGDWTHFIVYKTVGTRAWMMLRDNRYKYVRYIYKDYLEELYDLEKDPDELNNLAVRKENHPLLAQYRAKLVKAFAAKGASFVELLPPPRIVPADP